MDRGLSRREGQCSGPGVRALIGSSSCLLSCLLTYCRKDFSTTEETDSSRRLAISAAASHTAGSTVTVFRVFNSEPCRGAPRGRLLSDDFIRRNVTHR